MSHEQGNQETQSHDERIHLINLRSELLITALEEFRDEPGPDSRTGVFYCATNLLNATEDIERSFGPPAATPRRARRAVVRDGEREGTARLLPLLSDVIDPRD